MSGNFTVTASMRFLGEGSRSTVKPGSCSERTMDTDSPYIDIVIHGNGMPGIQWRNTKGDITNAVDFPSDGPAKFRLKLVARVRRSLCRSQKKVRS